MGNPNILASNEAVLAAVIDPDAYAAGTVSTGWLSMADRDRVQAIVMVGDMVTNSTVDAKIEQATDGSGTGAKDITGKAITQLTEAGTDSNKQAIINLRPEELDTNNGFTHFRLSMTVATAASDAGAIVLSHNSRYFPEADVSSVDEVVS